MTHREQLAEVDDLIAVTEAQRLKAAAQGDAAAWAQAEMQLATLQAQWNLIFTGADHERVVDE